MSSMLMTRWLLVAVSAVIAVVLITRGDVLIGGLIAVLAAGRAVMLVQMQRRRERFRQRIEARRAARGARWRSGSGPGAV
jgi:hypothetical protein